MFPPVIVHGSIVDTLTGNADTIATIINALSVEALLTQLTMENQLEIKSATI